MKRSHGLFLIVALLGIGVVLSSTHINAEPPEGANSAPSVAGVAAGREADQLASLQREIVQLRGQVRAQGERLASAATAPVIQGNSQATADRGDPRTEAERRQEEERSHREYIAGIDAAFRKEAAEPGWAAATSAAVQAAITETGELPQLAQSVECRSNMCRVEFTDDGSGKLASILPMFTMRVVQQLPSIDARRIEDASGTATMVLYMSRHSANSAPVVSR